MTKWKKKQIKVLATQNAESKNPKAARTKNRTMLLLSKCTVCDD